MTGIVKGISLEALAALVSETLEQAGLVAVLSGGAAVSLYSANQYQSRDLDFVSDEARLTLEKLFMPLGFVPKHRYLSHPDTDYFIEFPAGPLAIGDEVIRETQLLETPYGRVRIISPMHCVMDRLAAFYHWGDRPSLDQAVLVAGNHPDIDFGQIEAWSRREGAADKYAVFAARLAKI